MLALCSVLAVRRSGHANVLTSTSAIGQLWLDPENLPFRRRVISQIRRRHLQLQPHVTEESSTGRLERRF